MKLFRHFDELQWASLVAQGDCFQMLQVSTGPRRIAFSGPVKNGENSSIHPLLFDISRTNPIGISFAQCGPGVSRR
jgi:hypothetical protein